jgi:hypothetical protein
MNQSADASPADSDDEVAFRILHPPLVACDRNDEVPTPHLLSVPLLALNLPCRLAAAADALLGMVNINLLLLLLHHILEAG